MSRNRVIYGVEGLFVGPPGSTGYHAINYLGSGIDDYSNAALISGHNLLKQIDRVQSLSYSINTDKQEITHLGKRGLIDRPIIISPTVELSFDYLINSVKNEARLGLNVNYSQFEGLLSGRAYETGGYLSLISGLIARDIFYPTGDPYFPPNYRDKRNLFFVVGQEGQDLLKQSPNKEDFTTGTWYQGINSGNSGYHVISFGNSYLTSYRTAAAINSLPVASVGFLAENVKWDSSGLSNIPGLYAENRTEITDKRFYIPAILDEGGPPVLLPGDITLDISATGENKIVDLGVDFTGISIQNYDIGFSLQREPLDSLGYKLPIDRQINFPVLVDFNFGVLVGDSQTGSLVGFINKNQEYNAKIKLKKPCYWGSGVVLTGAFNDGIQGYLHHTVIQYDLKRLKFNNVGYSNQIGNNTTANFSFSTELDPDDLTKGWFISGLLNIEKVEDFILGEDGSYILDEDGQPIVTNYIPLY